MHGFLSGRAAAEILPSSRLRWTRHSLRRHKFARRKRPSDAFSSAASREAAWRIDVSVAVNLSIAQETRILQTRNQPQHSRLVAKLQMILKSDQVIGIGPQVFLPQLHGRVRYCPVRGSFSPTGFIGPNRSVSRPRRAISSMGRQPSK